MPLARKRWETLVPCFPKGWETLGNVGNAERGWVPAMASTVTRSSRSDSLPVETSVSIWYVSTYTFIGGLPGTSVRDEFRDVGPSPREDFVEWGRGPALPHLSCQVDVLLCLGISGLLKHRS